MGRTLHTIAVAAGAAALLAPAAQAVTPPPRDPWATVNVCDTAGHPDGVGVRAWMPGQGGSVTTLELRIRLQYRKGTEWFAVKGADSGWIMAGTGDLKGGEAGQTFTVTPPRAGSAYVIRGLVAFRWRKGAVVTRYLRRSTRAGHPATAGADPRDFSAATCTVH